ncbi:MAG: hypothetical protein P8J37_05915 [Fuerstiella sp.]|nr:hypothetical protein [Fuerstiella sp.]
MTIKVQCPSCSKRYAIKKRLNGRKIRCVDCSAVISIPITDSNEKQTSDSRSQSQQDKFAASASDKKPKASRRTAAPSGAEPRKALRSDAGAKPMAKRRRVRGEASSRKNGAASIPTDSPARQKWLSAAFQSDEIQPVAPTRSYRFAVFLVAILMIALPIIYIGLIGVIVVATWFSVSAIMSTAGPALGGALSAFVVLTVIAIVLFMLKPLFGKPPHTSGRRTVEREDEPLLFDFVERICDIVEAPHPAEIEIDCTINAAASFNRGLLSLLSGDLRLTVGISMVAGLNVRQFAGNRHAVLLSDSQHQPLVYTRRL